MTPTPRVPRLDLSPLPEVGRTFVAGFESTYLPAHDIDLLEVTGHRDRWREDLADVRAAGIRHLRYPLRWQHIQRESGRFDWAETDRVLGHLHDTGAVPIVDLVHHTTYPRWLSNGFRGPDFRGAFLHYVEAVATRYPWIPAYTLFNEPFATLFLSGHEGLWPPFGRGMGQFAGLLTTVLPALADAARCAEALWPDARHVWVDTAEHHTGVDGGEGHAALANDRRHVVLDLMLGHDLDPRRPFLSRLIEAGGESLLDLDPLRVDVLGLDYYCHSEWHYDAGGARSPSPCPVGLATLVEQYGDRYDLPMMITETNIRGFATDKIGWLKYTLEQYELALSRGARLHGYCWFPQVDSCDWDSLLARSGGRVDPVGVYSLGPDGCRQESAFTRAWRAAANGMPAAELPAHRLQEPCSGQLAGWRPAMAAWRWTGADDIPAHRIDLPHPHRPKDPSLSRSPSPLSPSPLSPSPLSPLPLSRLSPSPVPPSRSTSRSTPSPSSPSRTAAAAGSTTPADGSDLVVLSHLRWPWVWQRPQHLVSRISALRAGSGSLTWFVEEPVVGDVAEPELATQELDGIRRVWLVVPRAHPGDEVAVGFTDRRAREYGDLVAALLRREGRAAHPDVWLYSPLAFDLCQRLDAGRIVYDLMDDLASFRDSAPGMVLSHRRALTEADLVFTGGRSLDRGVRVHRQRGVHLFPSGVDQAHYSASRALRGPRVGKVAGYVGVIDERLDLDLLGGLAAALPDWTISVVGPVTKIDPADLPDAANLEYPGFTAYEQLPTVMAGFDVALMPFALNEATRSISPTKTLEYLAAGLPVVSTRVPDVVGDYAEVVSLADDPAGFARACREAVQHGQAAREEREARVSAMLDRQEWDAIATAMYELLQAVRPAGAGAGAGAGADSDEVSA